MNKKLKREKRHNRVRSKIAGTTLRPRLSVFRSNRFMSAQVIDDTKGATLLAHSTRGSKNAGNLKGAEELAKELASKLKKSNIEAIVFDRGGFLYTGKVKLLADTLRQEGINF